MFQYRQKVLKIANYIDFLDGSKHKGKLSQKYSYHEKSIVTENNS